MKSKGAVKLFAIALTIVCIFQLSFTWVTNKVENDAKAYAEGDQVKERAYLDSVARLTVYNLGIAKYTYLQCKERELNLGLDLQGGMNVTLEVSIGDLVRSLANESPDPAFNKAIALTNERIKSTTKDYVTVFGESYAEVAPDGKLAVLFANQTNKDLIKISSTNEEVIAYLKNEASQAIDRSFQILRARIDKFGVTQPNIQKLEGSGRILVELPGVDNPTRVRKLLQGTAKLEFWETFDNPEAYKHLSTANDVLKKVLANETNNAPADTTAQASTDTTTAASSALAGIGATNTAPATDTTKVDTATANQEKSIEEFTKENPLFVLLRPYADEQNMLVAKGSMCGTALIKDTAKINTYLNRPEVKAALPSNIRFLWAYKGFGDNGEGAILHAVKTSKEGKASLEGDKITDARRDISQSGQTEVSMTMNAEGASVWRKLTKANIGKSIAIVLDDVVYSSPNVQNEIPNGRSSISGGFTTEEASDLANILKAGKLPAPTRIVEEAVVGPTLGAEAISNGLASMVIATVVILIFMVVYYNNSGYIADIAVLINVFFIMGVLASLGAALTLPGIAGIVLTIGMAVDANVLINERVKEELAGARSLKNAVADGYAAASSSIIDANLTTLIAGFVLYVFGTGPVQGFAITLIIGILSSMFTAVLLTRVITEWRLDKQQLVKYARGFSEKAFQGITYDWVGKRKRFYIFSSLIIGVGLFSMFTKGFTLGVDFQGGWTYVVQFDNPQTASDIREKLTVPFAGAPEVKTFGSDNKFKITTTYLIDDRSENAGEMVEAKLNEGLSAIGGKAEILSSSKVGPTIANDIKTASFWAAIIALLGIGFYILVRFRKWTYALGATIALAHDVLMMLSFYSIFDGILPFTMEVDQAFIAAVLTIIGFSINDTVVVFDRIREFLGTHHHETNKKMVINNALNNTLNRTIITSLTVFLVALILFIFGGEVIKGFTFALLVGIVFGTYSSIAIATPIVVDFDSKNKEPEPKQALA
ncbi:MAG: protein translocase subunit SecDF [Bacteroidia bacterium]|jgi:SecD/SecF fusion protein|nr:protein translocase subunit SecDF [Bacteroidia bacterium]